MKKFESWTIKNNFFSIFIKLGKWVIHCTCHFLYFLSLTAQHWALLFQDFFLGIFNFFYYASLLLNSSSSSNLLGFWITADFVTNSKKVRIDSDFDLIFNLIMKKSNVVYLQFLNYYNNSKDLALCITNHFDLGEFLFSHSRIQ